MILNINTLRSDHSSFYRVKPVWSLLRGGGYPVFTQYNFCWDECDRSCIFNRFQPHG